VKCCIKFVAAVVLVSTTSLINPPPLRDSDPAPICDPTTQNCKPPMPPQPVR
jgi:hypothetical protein